MALLNWFYQFGRHDLPWQQNKTPYRVWVSEIMLQQTQVQTVIPYFQKFMARFPSLIDLAKANQQDVLAHWSGLGYYARARNLHLAAQRVYAQHGGELPEDMALLLALPGIGQSTAGAILSIAFNQRAPILDGNVKRILCRIDRVAGWSGHKPIETQLWQRANDLTPYDAFGDYTQAIMDLGATICTRSKPKCDMCPVSDYCEAKQFDQVTQFPHSKPKVVKPVKATALWLIENTEGRFWFEKRPTQGIWGGLWCLPEQLPQDFDKCRQAGAQSLVKWQEFKHSFTHFHLWITPCYLKGVVAPLGLESEKGAWLTLSQALNRGLPAPVIKLINQLENTNG